MALISSTIAALKNGITKGKDMSETMTAEITPIDALPSLEIGSVQGDRRVSILDAEMMYTSNPRMVESTLAAIAAFGWGGLPYMTTLPKQKIIYGKPAADPVPKSVRSVKSFRRKGGHPAFR